MTQTTTSFKICLNGSEKPQFTSTQTNHQDHHPLQTYHQSQSSLNSHLTSSSQSNQSIKNNTTTTSNSLQHHSGPSEFVKKLYKMLEDVESQQIVSWGPTKDSLIVRDQHLFQTHILPRHFKHSNFASFVRQLNKYDFRKVRLTPTTSQPLGTPSILRWEFHHPHFRADTLADLDHIKRKIPATKKTVTPSVQPSTSTSLTDFHPSPSSPPPASSSPNTSNLTDRLQAEIDSLTAAHATTQAQLQRLMDSHSQLASELGHCRETISEQHRRLERLDPPDREKSQQGSPPFGDLSAYPYALPNNCLHTSSSHPQLPQLPQLPSSSSPISLLLPQATTDLRVHHPQPASIDILSSGSASVLTSQHSDQNHENVPAIDHQPPSVASVGPLYWSIPSEVMSAFRKRPTDHQASDPQTQIIHSNMPSKLGSWLTPPTVLVVEDDQICRTVSARMLEWVGCQMEMCSDGVHAVRRMGERTFDLVLMDIFMPQMDGLLATSLIRRFDMLTPIISMTSSSQPLDVKKYIGIGMNDCLPKPFTKENMLLMLEKHLVHRLVDQNIQAPERPHFNVLGSHLTSTQPGLIRPEDFPGLDLNSSFFLPQSQEAYQLEDGQDGYQASLTRALENVYQGSLIDHGSDQTQDSLKRKHLMIETEVSEASKRRMI